MFSRRKKLEIYEAQQKLAIDIEVQNYRTKLLKEIEDLAFACARDKGGYEHDFHSAKENLRAELAKLEALKETMENDTTTYKQWLKEKDAEIKRLNDIIHKMIENQPKTVIQQTK